MDLQMVERFEVANWQTAACALLAENHPAAELLCHTLLNPFCFPPKDGKCLMLVTHVSMSLHLLMEQHIGLCKLDTVSRG
jgi:hypothetical protein